MLHQQLLRPRALRSATVAQFARTYTSKTGDMPTRTIPLRTIIRQTTLRATPTTLQLAYPLSPQFAPRPRSPSPPPPYQTRGISVLAPQNQWTRFSTPYTLSSVRTFASTPRIRFPAQPSSAPSSPSVEEAIEEIQELYGTARDEFEIAAEETEKNTTYAPDDRAAAREELDKLLEYYRGVTEGADKGVGEEVKRRVGGRIRELEHAVLAMEEAALHH
ncbi:hypothetical protein P153DRAFT_364614, partial [Dothidotthia symphoricarpi CBS 119687]